MSKQRDEALIRAAMDRATATERERCLAIIADIADHYPETVFLPTSNSPDAIAAKGARLACENAAAAIRRGEGREA